MCHCETRFAGLGEGVVVLWWGWGWCCGGGGVVVEVGVVGVKGGVELQQWTEEERRRKKKKHSVTEQLALKMQAHSHREAKEVNWNLCEPNLLFNVCFGLGL